MTAFALQFDPADIPALADRFSYPDDAGPRQAGRAAKSRGYYTRDDFLTVCHWKTARSGPLVDINTAACVETKTRAALAATDERDRMQALLSLKGVAVPTASGLLHFAFPDEYGILDVRALESLGVDGRGTYSVKFWLDYLDSCRRLAGEHGVSLRTLDKALWQHSKERSAP